MKWQDIIKQVIGWGIGAVLMIAGVLIMIFHKKLDIGFPEYLYIGFGTVIVGAIIYIFMAVLNYLKDKSDKEILLESQTKDIVLDEEKISKWKEIIANYKSTKTK